MPRGTKPLARTKGLTRPMPPRADRPAPPAAAAGGAGGASRMSEYRDSLPDDATRARYDEAIAAAAKVLARARRERDMLAAAHGTRAVAEAAWYPGHPLGSVEAIEASYTGLREQARRPDAATEA